MSDSVRSRGSPGDETSSSWPKRPAWRPDPHARKDVETIEPLVVELDHDLVRSSIFSEFLFALGSQRPLSLLRILPRLRTGRPAFEAMASDLVEVDIATLPFDVDVIAFLTAERRRGRRIILASSSPQRLVDAVAAHVGIFDDVVVSTGPNTFASALEPDRLGHAYDYHLESPTLCRASAPGRSLSRIQARHPLVSDTGPSRGQSRRSGSITRSWGSYAAYIRCMRPHQWLKNLLILVPTLAAHQFGPPLIASLVAFVSFSLCASSVYILNDLLDLRSDRAHARKRLRPFASGEIPLLIGLVLSLALLALAIAIACSLNGKFIAVLIGYYALTCVYSFWIKRQELLDVVALACLYGIRLLAGGAASGIALSPWLGALAIFLFFCLALVKRCTELTDRQGSSDAAVPGRGYKVGDLPILMNMAGSSGFVSVLVLALYLNSEAVRAMYEHPNLLWAACVLLLFWISRMLLLTHRGQMHDDPVVFAARDSTSLWIVCACAALMALST